MTRRPRRPAGSGRASRTVGGTSMDGLASLGLKATLVRSSPHVRVVRLIVLLGPLVTLGATMAARGVFQPIAFVLFGVLAVAGALSTDAHLGLLTMLLLALNWVQTVNDETTPWVLVAAGGLVMLHTGLAALTVAPPAARWRPDRIAAWTRRAVTAFAAAVATWALSVVFTDRSWSGNAVVLVAALVAVTATAAWLQARSSRG